MLDLASELAAESERTYIEHMCPDEYITPMFDYQIDVHNYE